MFDDFFLNPGEYVFYGAEYFITISLLLTIGIVVIQLSLRRSEAFNTSVQSTIAYLCSGAIIGYMLIEIALNRFNVQEDLPLVFCNLIALLLPVYGYFRRQWLFNVLYFIVLAGAIQSIITPALDYSLPHYDTLKFWIVHGGLVIFIFQILIVEKKLPTAKGIVHSFLFVQGYVLLIIAINYLIDANYLYLNEKPKTASILDLLGEWPYYIITMDLILIPYFVILYLPILVVKKLNRGMAK